MTKKTIQIVEIIGSLVVLSLVTASGMTWWKSRKYCDGQNQTGTATANTDNIILNEADLKQFSLDYCDMMRKDWDVTYATWQTKFSQLQTLLGELHAQQIKDGTWSNEGWRVNHFSYTDCQSKNMSKFGGNYGPMVHTVRNSDENLVLWRESLVDLDTMIKSKKPLCNVQIKK